MRGLRGLRLRSLLKIGYWPELSFLIDSRRVADLLFRGIGLLLEINIKMRLLSDRSNVAALMNRLSISTAAQERYQLISTKSWSGLWNPARINDSSCFEP